MPYGVIEGKIVIRMTPRHLKSLCYFLKKEGNALVLMFGPKWAKLLKNLCLRKIPSCEALPDCAKGELPRDTNSGREGFAPPVLLPPSPAPSLVTLQD